MNDISAANHIETKGNTKWWHHHNFLIFGDRNIEHKTQNKIKSNRMLRQQSLSLSAEEREAVAEIVNKLYNWHLQQTHILTDIDYRPVMTLQTGTATKVPESKEETTSLEKLLARHNKYEMVQVPLPHVCNIFASFSFSFSFFLEI